MDSREIESEVLNFSAGVAKLGFIYGDELEERRLKTGDIYVIPAGSVFYLVNIGVDQRLHVICSIDSSTRFGDTDTFQVYIYIHLYSFTS